MARSTDVNPVQFIGLLVYWLCPELQTGAYLSQGIAVVITHQGRDGGVCWERSPLSLSPNVCSVQWLELKRLQEALAVNRDVKLLDKTTLPPHLISMCRQGTITRSGYGLCGALVQLVGALAILRQRL